MTYSAMLSAITEVPAKTWIALSFLPIAGLFVLALWRADRGEESTFKFIHFVTNDLGRGSHYALGYTALVVVCTWGVWALIVLDSLTEWYLTLIIGGFIIGALGGTAARVVSKVKGVRETDAEAGDNPSEPPAVAPGAVAALVKLPGKATPYTGDLKPRKGKNDG